MSSRLVNCAAVFIAQDVKKTAEYYRNVMGFRVVAHFDNVEPFATLYRDAVEIIVVQSQFGQVLSNKVRYGSGYDVYLDPEDVEGVDALYEELKGKGANITAPRSSRPTGPMNSSLKTSTDEQSESAGSKTTVHSSGTRGSSAYARRVTDCLLMVRLLTDKSVKTNLIFPGEIAPCGMNYRLCRVYVRGRKACPACKGDDSVKPKTRITCHVKNCEKLSSAEDRYCFNCDNFPCAKLQHLDKRYRRSYGMSMIDNLENIRKFGMKCFIDREKERWTCPECGEIICVHEPECLSCRHKWR